MGILMSGHRPSESMRVAKWEAMWKGGTIFMIRSSSQATKSLIEPNSLRWRNPPITLKSEDGQPFVVKSLEIRRDSFIN